ncbi:MAG: 1-(5-phosphoribosyl)-5-[(5-phosphoribosylamino)methylideneamino]imidazole-4-carboxamide isomerase [Robiginitomaculum sp.]|nr:MAG: 1-(5-phosphoribosyl)-5-[(5-phosphoribosylamino)methylideneamino]imidazole-4-carboxamide isomerase [Robiginitomaculum sp.]
MIVPAIDLMDGGLVRLLKGDFSQRTNYVANPLDTAKSFADTGAKYLHIVDLDGAKNLTAEQSDLIIKIAQSVKKSGNMNVQTGGGLRTIEQIKHLLDGGVDRVVIGSLAVKDPGLVKTWMEELGPEKFVLAIDVFADLDGTPRPATHGWTQTSELSLWQVVDSFKSANLKTILVTDIARDGVLQGSNVELYADIMAKYPGLDLITSGGVGSLDDVRQLKALNPAGIIIGKALYENKFTLKQAIAC